MAVRLDLGEQATGFHFGDDLLARREPVEPVIGRDGRIRIAPVRGLGVGPEFVGVDGDHGRGIEDVDHAQPGAAADLEIIEVMGRGDLHRTGALFRVRVAVGDDFDLSPGDRQDRVLADDVPEAFVVRVHRNAGIAQHGLRARCGDSHETIRLAFNGIAEIPKMAVHLFLHNLEIGDRGVQLRVPVHKALVLEDQTLAVQLDEHLEDGLRQALVHREPLARPVA